MTDKDRNGEYRWITDEAYKLVQLWRFFKARAEVDKTIHLELFPGGYGDIVSRRHLPVAILDFKPEIR